METTAAFNDLELSFLELTRSRKINEDDIKALKKIWAGYFMLKATNAADKKWIEKKYDETTILNWIKGKE